MSTLSNTIQLNINPNIIMKEGYVKKRSGRMVQWTTRYFVLHETGLYYKLKQASDDHSDGITRGKFEFVPGCIVTDIIEENRVNIKGKKLYSFWIVWPHDKNVKNGDKNENDSDIEENDHIIDMSKDIKETQIKIKDEDLILRNNSNKTINTKNKDLQAIILREEDEQKRQKELVEEQVELHQAHDANVSNGAKIAAVTVGGFAIGALTMGIGLLPYLALVGVTVVASGGAVAYNRY